MTFLKRLGSACLVLLGVALVRAQCQDSAALSYTRAQAEAGRAAYTTYCVTCHGPHLSDGPQGAPLKGPAFMKKYGDRSVLDLFQIARTTMPTANPGSLDATTYASLVAFLLQDNAIVAGPRRLPSDPRALAGMNLPASGFSIMAYSPYTAQKRCRCPIPWTTSSRSRKADLTNPPAQDWLTWRRGWNAHGFSPLKQITAANAAQLRLVWSWTLPEGSTESVPLVRDGTFFVLGFGDIVQALNAGTGDLLWQYSPVLEPGVAPFIRSGAWRCGQIGSISGHSDVHVLALNARTGKLVWDTRSANNKAHESSTGVRWSPKAK